MNESIVTELWDQLRTTPDGTALYDGTDRWTYRELHTAANRIAGRLQREGVGPGDRVGICMPRTNDAIASILGVLIAGGAYIPLDPGYPRDRLAFMCKQATAKVVLGPPELTEGLPLDAVLLDPSEAAQLWEAPEGRSAPPDLAHRRTPRHRPAARSRGRFHR